MRIRITIDPGLLAEARALAVASGRTLDAVVEDALRGAFAARAISAGRAVATRPAAPTLPVFRGSRLRPGVDLGGSAALLEQMERAER